MRPEAKKRSMMLWWVALGVVIVTVVAGGLFFRTSIAVLYPPANKLFMALGIPADTLGHGLKIHTPKATPHLDGKDRVLTIKGEIENTLSHVADIPLLRGSVRNTAEEDLHVWTFKAVDERILPGEKVEYSTEVRNPPRGGTGLHITFTKPEEVAADSKKKLEKPDSGKGDHGKAPDAHAKPEAKH
jgi:hypothetical protein